MRYTNPLIGLVTELSTDLTKPVSRENPRITRIGGLILFLVTQEVYDYLVLASIEQRPVTVTWGNDDECPNVKFIITVKDDAPK